jgi:B12-binding domain/radical SAM domain protein
LQQQPPRFVILERPETKYSVRAVVAAAEHGIRGLRVDIVYNLDELVARACSLASRGYPTVAGTSLVTELVVKEFERIRAATRRLRSCGVLALAGGAHATGDPYGTIRILGYHAVVVGEAEETLPELLEAYADAGIEGLEAVRGVAFEAGDEVVYTGRRRPIDLDSYPPFPYWRGLFSPIEITRGCVWACGYCETWFIHGGRHRHRSIERIVEYARLMLERGLKDLRFITPNGLAYGERVPGKPEPDRLEALLSQLYSLARSYGGRVFYGSFPSEVRPDYVSDETVKPLAGRVSNRSIIVGAQSGSDRVLKMIHRGHSVDDVINAVEVLNRYGFQADVDIIVGLPFEDEEDMEATLRICWSLVTRYKARIHLHTFMPLPGTPLESYRAKPLPPRLQREYYRLIGTGRAYGYWLRQAEISKLISDMYERGLILGLRGWRRMRIRRGGLLETAHQQR